MRSDAPALLPIFRSRLQAELLTWLLLHPDREDSITDLAIRLHAPLSSVHDEATRLVQADLLASRSVGRSRLLRANAANRAVQPLTHLLTVTYGPHLVIADEFAGLPGVEEVHIYGSWAARYTGIPGRTPADIDVLVIGTPNRRDLYQAADRAETRLGIPVNPAVRTRGQWAGSDPLVDTIRDRPLVLVHSRAAARAEAPVIDLFADVIAHMDP